MSIGSYKNILRLDDCEFSLLISFFVRGAIKVRYLEIIVENIADTVVKTGFFMTAGSVHCNIVLY